MTFADITKWFSKVQEVYFATVDNSQPKVRPMSLIYLDHVFYVATNNDDAKMEQIKQNPKIEYCLTIGKPKQQGYIRASCIANIVDDLALKQYVYDEIEFIRYFWDTATDASFALLRLDPKFYEFIEPGEMEAVYFEV